MDGAHIDDLIIDEVQFLDVKQVDQLGEIADHYGIDVHAFGIRADFTGALFPGTQRMMEIADERVELQVETMCWCGRRAVFNARIVDGVVARTGPQVLLGDTDSAAEVYYRVLCRRHYNEGRIS
jgi:thymidine kinase